MGAITPQAVFACISACLYAELAALVSRIDIASSEARALLRRNDYRAAEKIIDDVSAELAKRAELISSL